MARAENEVFIRVFFQIVVKGGEGIPPSSEGESKILLGGFFYWLRETWGGVILTIQTFFKAKNSFLWILSIN